MFLRTQAARLYNETTVASHMPHAQYLPELMGSARIEPGGEFEAGCYQSFVLTYTAGRFGIDDTGSIKIVHRFASDMGKPQFEDSGAPNYVTVEASNGAVLYVAYDQKQNIRPWDKTLYIKVVRGFLREGDRIAIRFGDPRKGSPGMRLQTFCEPSFEFKVLVDAFATYDYTEIVDSPTIAIVPGAPVHWKGILPTQRALGEPFRLCLKVEDRWGNPSDRADETVVLCPSHPVAGLPGHAVFSPGTYSQVFDGLTVDAACDLHIDLVDAHGECLARTNPLRVGGEGALRPYWGDLHGQSEETIGTNSAREFFEFARDKAFLDVCSHQGNDFQITTVFWEALNELTREFDRPGEFVVFPGYEWSGNTGLGGDRNVLFAEEGQQIHRSSHALVYDRADADTDAFSATQLFDALKNEDCVVFAHIGGRYADIKMSHDVRLERAVEVHSAWGTFEWLIQDAFEQGYRVGIVSNSDGHKGRPGASYPGASLFGAYGGLTCILAKDLSRQSILDALRKRHHYGTTGCRMLLDTRVKLSLDSIAYDSDPRLGPSESRSVYKALMGDIVETQDRSVTFAVDVHGSAPIERIELRNGIDTLETVRPYEESSLGRRIRAVWEGSEYRGRGRQTVWDGDAELVGNAFERVQAINFYNLDKTLDFDGESRLAWRALTTGGFSGFDAWLSHPSRGTLRINTPLVRCETAVEEIGMEDRIFSAGGINRRLRLFRLPDENVHTTLCFERNFELRDDKDNAFYVCVTQEDGHLAWSSPIYVFR